jgi:hypothetical protein
MIAEPRGPDERTVLGSTRTDPHRTKPGAMVAMLRRHGLEARIDDVHETLAYLSRVHVQRRFRRTFVLELLRIVEDGDIHPIMRGGSAEAVGIWLPTKQRSLRRIAIRRLLIQLHDEAPDVRFWCSFTLGQLRAKQARSMLQRLTIDQTIVEGWWSVGHEARTALPNTHRQTGVEDASNGRPAARAG